eukprot:CAMPEP_0114543322 /NCGR_PEP_ID=MMETSP0114-20121206/2293_1 /TAXON_ID=31324 /ORGANISM="Goniomonas sp, Strain m" /LENGTH=146 /DNA_ID=CAMNT_0001727651 /DNA_START=586 /DNA_END=1027 /DNA_ORIENTATION=+
MIVRSGGTRSLEWHPRFWESRWGIELLVKLSQSVALLSEKRDKRVLCCEEVVRNLVRNLVKAKARNFGGGSIGRRRRAETREWVLPSNAEQIGLLPHALPLPPASLSSAALDRHDRQLHASASAPQRLLLDAGGGAASVSCCDEQE